MTEEERKKAIDEIKDRPPMPFQEFLDKSSGMLTVFAVLNALAIYTASIKDQDQLTSYTLTFCFWLMSCIVWFEFFQFTVRSNGFRKTSMRIAAMHFLSFLALLMFGRLMLKQFPDAMQITLGIIIVICLCTLFMWLLKTSIVDKYLFGPLAKVSSKKRIYGEGIGLIILVVTLGVMYLSIKLSVRITPYIFEFIQSHVADDLSKRQMN